MGEYIKLTARDGHTFSAYRADPSGKPVAGVVIVQEIFGLTSHVCAVVDRYAAAGFAAIAPAVFDRVEPDLVLAYSEIERGRATMQQLEWGNTLADVQASVDALGALPVGVVGFCWGGTVAFVAASELPIGAAVSYYGTGVARMLDKKPKCPVMYHFGDRDQSIPAEAIERIREAHPEGIYHIYAGADHGFDCRDRASFSPTDAEVAFERSVAFLREHLGQRSA